MLPKKHNEPRFVYEEAFKRNLGLITPEEQEKLREATIAIPGMGGVGGIHLVTLARMGIGGFHIADQDNFELANRNRQFGATDSTLGLSKSKVMGDVLFDVNPEARLKQWNKFIDASNVDAFLSDVDVVIDSLDAFAIDARLLLFSKARELGIPVISAGPIGFSCAQLVVTKDSPSLFTYLDLKEGDTFEKRFIKFILGLTPSPYFLRYMNTGKIDFTGRSGPSVASATALCAGSAATTAIKLILGRGVVKSLPHYTYFDPYLNLYKNGWMPFGNRNPIQKLKYFFITRFKLEKK